MGKDNSHEHEPFRAEGMSKHKRPAAAWEDLNLSQATTASLRELCSQFKHDQSLSRRWGLRKEFTGGNRRSAIFSGPPCAGKTLAAEIMAKELAVGLIKVGLSRVISKYIGETEKNLTKLFARAEREHAILFFDEADELFEKRTATKDERRRYANLEIGYLLQRVEKHSGIVLLAANLKANLDPAFTRRLQYVIDFRLPDEEEDASSNSEA
jgi:SpoVK/Ycf46/Vps4 family AAA+-type ATPase